MSRNLWLPFWINITLLLAAVPIIGILPDVQDSPVTAATRALETADEEGPLLAERPSPDKYYTAFESDASIFHKLINAVCTLVNLVIGRRNFQIMLMSFFLTALASSDTKLLVQYISKRYDWTFAEVGNIDPEDFILISDKYFEGWIPPIGKSTGQHHAPHAHSPAHHQRIQLNQSNPQI